ncbi:MAG TPA: NUDIX domain-containing protein [Trebonia sp.]|jgi:8-oxo-dGTP diphosphatase|nr:NUDIX domain-containing protein [Trebonia sp.]
MPPLTATCLCLITSVTADGQRQVLLGHKKTGLGTGKIVGLGGHVEEGETPAEAAAREAKEESGVHVPAGGLAEAAFITFLFPVRPAWSMTVAVFTAAAYSGDPVETSEIRPEWFPLAALPLGRMWDDARQWLPRVLDGERLRATFTYAADCQTVAAAHIEPWPA